MKTNDMNGDGSAEGLLTGQHGLDGEHRFQLELLTAFARALKDGRGDAAFDEILDTLIEYTKVHFSSEELLMRLYQYPAYQEHVDDHERIVERLEDLRRAGLAGGEASAGSAGDQPSDWISAPIARSATSSCASASARVSRARIRSRLPAGFREGCGAKALAYAPWLRHHPPNERAHRLLDEAQRWTGDEP